MLQDLAQPLFVFDLVLLGAVLLLYVWRIVARAWGRDATDELIRRQMEEGGAFSAKERELAIAEIEAQRLAQQVGLLRRQFAKLKADSDKVARGHFDIVHLVGEPGGDRHRFEGRLHVPGGPAGLPARVVLASHIVVVFAEGLSAAKRLLEVSYNGRTGYSVGPLADRNAAPPAEASALKEAAR